MLGGDAGTLMVARDIEPLGFVAWRKRPTTRTSHCWHIGIAGWSRLGVSNPGPTHYECPDPAHLCSPSPSGHTRTAI